jgi:DNA segregation ATPase FtsK/SpoIIIE, S-DNA-T family
MISRLIALLAFKTVRHVFSGSAMDSQQEAGQLAVRMKNLQSDEIRSFLEIWEEQSAASGLAGVKVVIASDSGLDVEPKYLAHPDHSITYYRGNIDGGLLYLQTKIETDEQGLESLFTIQDRNYLDGSLDVSGVFSAEEELITLCWQAVSGNENPMPRKMPELLSFVRKALNSGGVPISVRMYTAFAVKVCNILLPLAEDGIDPAALSRSVGNGFSALGLFPDDQWSGETAEVRRLLINFRFSDLMNASGVDLETEDLNALINKTQFKDPDGNDFQESENEDWRQLCRMFVAARTQDARDQIPFRIYAQIFLKNTIVDPGMLLGERVDEEITQTELEKPSFAGSGRSQEYRDMGLIDALNRREQEAARAFVEKDPAEEAPQDTPPLRDLIKPSTLKILLKLAYPPSKGFQNPFTEIVDVLRTYSTIGGLGGSTLELKLGRDWEKQTHQVGLFTFLYSRTLAEIAEISADDPSGVRLIIDEEILLSRSAPCLQSSEGNEAGDDTVTLEWGGLPISFAIFRDGSNNEREVIYEGGNLVWKPENIEWLAFFWIMTCNDDADDIPANNTLLRLDDGDYARAVADTACRVLPVNSIFDVSQISDELLENGVIRSLTDARSEYFASLSETGFDLSITNDYVTRWEALFQDARVDFLPKGVLDPRLDVTLSLDVVHSHKRSMALMNLSHPLRLRWLAKYFGELQDVCVSALGLGLELNEINDEYFLSSLANLSPHGQPPVIANAERTLLVPVSERGYAETFSAIKKEGAVTNTWRAELDDVSLGVVSKEVETYIHSHPHKLDGLSLLFVLPSGGSIPARMVELIRSRVAGEFPVHCHVFSPKSEWEELVADFQKLETESRISDSTRLNPPLQLFMNEWKSETDAAEVMSGGSFDIAIVPNFFGDKIDVHEQTEPPSQRAGAFHILYDRSDYVDNDADSGTVSIVLKPELPEQVLEDWSTMSVRLLRSEPISAATPENTDYVKLRIRFDEAAPLFSVLHECSHWVITLDHYVGRDQIESLPQKPDVLTVKEGVGQSGLYTLVVSSNAGKEFVIKRLARKLDRIAGSVDGLDTPLLADRVYREIRDVAPGLILKSLGVSRVTEEVLGLMVAKKIVEREVNVLGPHTVSVWISLDENTEWFGGDSGVRADLCRLDFRRENDRLKLGVVVVEGKLRQSYDRHGVDQVNRTVKFLSSVFLPSQNGKPSADARWWRQLILLAAQSASDNAVQSEGEFADGLSDVDVQDFREGDFDVEYIRGVFSICLYESTGDFSRSTEDGVEVFRSRAAEIVNLITSEDARPPLTPTPDPTSDRDLKEKETANQEKVAEISDRPSENVTDVDTTGDVENLSGEARPVSRQGLTEEGLRAMYQTIIDTLAEFQVNIDVPADGRPNYVEGPAFVQFRVKPAKGVNPDAVSKQSKALHMNLGLYKNQELHFFVDRGAVHIDVPKADEDRYYISAKEMWGRWGGMDPDSLRVPVGENQSGDIITIDFSSSNSPHLLIGGTTGSGKSEALNSILYGLINFYPPERVRLVLVDPKQVELAAFEGVPHLQGDIGYFDEDAVRSLADAVEEMQRRYKLFRASSVKSIAEFNSNAATADVLPRIVIVLDEYADLVTEPEVKSAIEGSMKRLAAKARACGIHVIIATQKPSAENLSTTIRSNLPAQLALKCRGRQESIIIMNESGAEALNGKGDAFIKMGDSVERIQCALYSESDEPKTIN